MAPRWSTTFAWRRLATLTDGIGNRLSGTPELTRAIDWALAEMKRDGLENVHAEPVMVPRWVRGRESAEIVEPAHHQIAMLGLGDSVGTPNGPVQAEAIVVHSFQEMEAASSRVQRAHRRVQRARSPATTRRDPIGPMVPRGPRNSAPSRCSCARSARPAFACRTPAASSTRANAPKIPGAAIASEDADRLQRMADRGDRIVLRLSMEAHFDADVAIGQRDRRTARP